MKASEGRLLRCESKANFLPGGKVTLPPPSAHIGLLSHRWKMNVNTVRNVLLMISKLNHASHDVRRRIGDVVNLSPFYYKCEAVVSGFQRPRVRTSPRPPLNFTELSRISSRKTMS